MGVARGRVTVRRGDGAESMRAVKAQGSLAIYK